MIVRWMLQFVLIGLGIVSATTTNEGIEGSKHDFSRKTWSKGQLCLPCHTPHSAGGDVAAPLWDHSPGARTSYKMFDGRPGKPGAASLLCLSCHDGSTAVDAYGGMGGDVTIPQRASIGARGNLSTDHPVGVAYPVHDKYFRSKAEVEAKGDVVLPGGRVECLSCHDVHNRYGHEKLLVKTNERSALCLSCHRK